MKLFISLLCLIAVATGSCTKNEVETEITLSEAVKSGDWMVLYFENNTSVDMGATFLKFQPLGKLVATKDGATYTGTWTEANAQNANTVTINLTTTDVKLQRTNRTWNVVKVSESLIDLQGADAGSNITVQLMKH